MTTSTVPATPRSTQLIGGAIDALLGVYLFSCAWRIVFPALLDTDVASFGSVDVVGMTVTALLLAVLGFTTGGSLGVSFVRGKLPTALRARTIIRHLGWTSFVISIWAGWIITKISPIEFFSSEGLQGAGRIFGALIQPNMSIVGQALEAMVVTVFTALMATVVAVPLAFIISFPAARNVMSASTGERAIYTSIRAVLNIARSMEPVIWAVIFSVWVGIGPFAGMLALVVHTVASLAKQYSEQIEDINDGPIEAISATGANRLQILWFAVVPQVVIPFLSFTIYRWDINVRMATVIGFVGGGGIGTLLTQYQGLAKFQEVGTLVIIITLVVWLLDVVSARIREALK